MLAKSARLTESGEFARATKSGVRYSTSNFVGYLYSTGLNQPTRAGLIIGKNVGNSVTRHRVARKIRHIIQARYVDFPNGALLVIKGLNQSAQADCSTEVSTILSNLVRKTRERAELK